MYEHVNLPLNLPETDQLRKLVAFDHLTNRSKLINISS